MKIYENIYVNDLEVRVGGKIFKFADDTKLARIVDNVEDAKLMQKDLDHLAGWADANQMQFNVDKCKIMQFGMGNIEFKYDLGGGAG